MDNKETLKEMQKALNELYELNESLRQEIEKLKAEKKVLNINWRTAIKVNDDLLKENKKLKEEIRLKEEYEMLKGNIYYGE